MPRATRIATAATGATTAAAMVPAWLLVPDPESDDWMDPPPVADDPAALLALLGEWVRVEVMKRVLTACPFELAID